MLSASMSWIALMFQGLTAPRNNSTFRSTAIRSEGTASANATMRRRDTFGRSGLYPTSRCRLMRYSLISVEGSRTQRGNHLPCRARNTASALTGVDGTDAGSRHRGHAGSLWLSDRGDDLLHLPPVDLVPFGQGPLRQ